jgi:hypothetical protein
MPRRWKEPMKTALLRMILAGGLSSLCRYGCNETSAEARALLFGAGFAASVDLPPQATRLWKNANFGPAGYAFIGSVHSWRL